MNSFSSLTRQVEDRIGAAGLLPPSPANLYEPCRYILGLGGKRIRPVLCLMANELFGDIEEDAWQAALALELFHNFTLAHDDIMDKAPLRRNKPTVERRFGLTAAILSGDVLMIHAYRLLGTITHAMPRTLALFTETAIEVCEGQQLDVDFEQRTDVSVEEYLEMIRLKTSVLLAASLRIGAVIGGATESAAGKLCQFGQNLGLAFQMRDDYLDAYGDPARTGKQVGGDIRDNKKTLLLLHAMAHAPAATRTEIDRLIQHPPEDKIPRMLAIFGETGARDHCLSMIRRYSDQAFASLEELAVVSRRKQELFSLTEMLLDRQH